MELIKIVDIDTYKGETVFIEIEGGEKYFVHQSMIYEFHLHKGMEIPPSALEEVMNENLYRKAKERALYLLDNREYGYAELFKKLEENYGEDICYRVCNKLAELHLIDDRRYAARLAEYYSCTKKFGKYRAKQEIMRRGISSALAEEVLAEYEDDSVERLRELVERKYERKLTDRKSAEKVRAALVRQGYSFSDIKEVLSEYEFD